MQRVCGILASLVVLAIEVLTTVLFEGLTSEMERRWQMDGLLRNALGNALSKVPHQSGRQPLRRPPKLLHFRSELEDVSIHLSFTVLPHQRHRFHLFR